MIMLTGLYIENIAVIQKAGIDFEAGLNVLTGETGAGKSIVIDSINAALGERISRDVVRTGSDKAQVTAVFSGISASCIQKLEELGYSPDEDGSLLIQRTISAEGKGGCRINGQPVTVSLLREVGRVLVNIHGQHENQALLSQDRHVEYLERMGNLSELKDEYTAAYRKWRETVKALEKQHMDEGEKSRRIDMLKFQIDEINAVAVKQGEMDDLLERRAMFRNAEKIISGVAGAKDLLSGGEDYDGALSMLHSAEGCLSDAERHVQALSELVQRMQSARFELEECTSELRDVLSGFNFEPDELERTENRLSAIRRLIPKYGADEAAVAEFLAKAENELEGIELSDMRAADLEKELIIYRAAMDSCAARLTEARKRAGADFEHSVGEQLSFLDMPGVRLVVSVEPQEPDSTGADIVEFLISANPGETPKSIAKIASGGELSRIMLAIKAVMADADDIDTLVFDEIDTGISGRAAQKVGQKLRETANGRQVLCVTHLASIAAQAHNQYLIEKTIKEDRTFTNVSHLSEEQRIHELARIIDGERSPAAMDAAREMLARAGMM